MAEFALSELPEARRPAADRGSLVVRDRAMSHIVEYAVEAMPGVVRYATTLDKLRGRRLPHADVQIRDSRAWVSLDVAATWPCRVGELTASVRDRVLVEARRLSGIDVVQVDVRLQLVDPASIDSPVPRRVQ